MKQKAAATTAAIKSNLTNGGGPSVGAADCSEAFIRARRGGNNGIIVLDGGCRSCRYLDRSANFFWHRAGSAWQ